MKKILLLSAAALAIGTRASAQGCVAIRSNGAACTIAGAGHGPAQKPSLWTLGVNARHFRSYKHFVGTEEQKERTERGTEVINETFATELGLTRRLNNRWSVALFVPVTSNVRSSMYEHYGNASTSKNARRSTRSFGLGDLRVAAYYWLKDPEKMPAGNLQVGFGLKLPTGDYRYTDYFYRNDSIKVLGPVDQSIQLGDGGTGIFLELNAVRNLGARWGLYGNAFYLSNPREHNGVSTARGGTPSAANIANGSDVMSVPDQYMARLGASFNAGRWLLTAGGRIEGLPARDLVGGSNGFRRPGYIVSAEPVAAYRWKGGQAYLSVPYALVRDRVQSVPDKIRTGLTGTYTKGDAAFADYSINLGVSFPL